MLNLSEWPILCNAIAAGAPRKRQIAHDHAYRLSNSNRGDGEIRPTQPERRQPYKKRSEHRNSRRSQKSKVMTSSRIDQQRRGVGTKTVKHRESKRHLAGKTTNNVPGNAGDHPDKRCKQNAYQVGTGIRCRQQQKDQQHQKRKRGLPVSSPRGRHATRHFFSSNPATPLGSTSRTTTSRA